MSLIVTSKDMTFREVISHKYVTPKEILTWVNLISLGTYRRKQVIIFHKDSITFNKTQPTYLEITGRYSNKKKITI